MKKVSTSLLFIATFLFMHEQSCKAAALDGAPPLTLKSNIIKARGGGHGGGGRDFHGGNEFHGNREFQGDNAFHGDAHNLQDHNAVTRHYNQYNYYGDGGYADGVGVNLNGNQNCYFNSTGQYICN